MPSATCNALSQRRRRVVRPRRRRRSRRRGKRTALQPHGADPPTASHPPAARSRRAPLTTATAPEVRRPAGCAARAPAHERSGVRCAGPFDCHQPRRQTASRRTYREPMSEHGTPSRHALRSERAHHPARNTSRRPRGPSRGAATSAFDPTLLRVRVSQADWLWRVAASMPGEEDTADGAQGAAPPPPESPGKQQLAAARELKEVLATGESLLARVKVWGWPLCQLLLSPTATSAPTPPPSPPRCCPAERRSWRRPPGV